MDNLHVHEQRILACLILRVEERRAIAKCRELYRDRSVTEDDVTPRRLRGNDGVKEKEEEEEEEEEEEVNELERARMLHQERNREYLRHLGILGEAEVTAPAALAAKSPRPRAVAKRGGPAREALRKSGRLTGQKAEFSGDMVDALQDDSDDDSDEDGPGVLPPAKRRKGGVRYDAALENAQRWLEENRAALLRHVADATSPSGTDPWRDEAIRRWGNRVGANSLVSDWEAFVRSRMSKPLPVSPDPLLQEYYCFDAWRLLCSCALMSRVSSDNTKHTCISSFFERFPTPSALLDASPDNVLPTVLPLGLFPTRYKTVVEVSRKFLEMPVFAVSKDPEFKIYGVGDFTLDSYRLFVQGDFDFTPGDKNLKAFVAWQRKNAQKGAQPA